MTDKARPKDGAQRKRDYDKRQRDQGRRQFLFWLTDEEATEMRKHLAKLRETQQAME